MAYKNLNAMKTAILDKVKRRLANNFPDYEYDDDFLGDYFDDAVSIIKDWKKTYDNSIFYEGNYDRNIVQFIIESINVSGLEGQSSGGANGVSKNFYATPEANLKSSIPQSL